MTLWQNYLRPKTLAEAMIALSSAPAPVAPIAGGTDLLVDLEQGRHAPVQTLLDLSDVDELLRLEIRQDEFFIGAGVPVNRIVLDPLARQHAQALVEACNLIGGPQVRNVATLGGNVAHALPAADGTIALLALDVEAEIAGPFASAAVLRGASRAKRAGGGESPAGISINSRRVPFKDLFLGPGKSAVKHGEELLVGFYAHLITAGQASCFQRIMRPQGVALPIINVAMWLKLEGDTIRDIRIAVGPGAGIPFRAASAEKALRGQAFTPAAYERAVEALLAETQFRSSARRASADYRRHLVEALFKDTLEAAWERASKL
ncbi:MAG TPA: FAD binding domain-containing protein [Anaerolineales bacterium]